MTERDVVQLLLVAVAGVLAPLVAATVRRFAVPAVVLELAFGIVLGPQLLGWIDPSPKGVVRGLADLGLSMLMFLAGYELRLQSMRGRPIRRALVSWVMSVVLAAIVGFGFHLAGGHSGEIVIPLAATTTALGTLLPVLRDAGVLHTTLGRDALALGSVGEFGPIVLVALLLSGDDAFQSILVLGSFGLLIVLAGRLASRPWGESVVAVVRKGL